MTSSVKKREELATAPLQVILLCGCTHEYALVDFASIILGKIDAYKLQHPEWQGDLTDL